MIMNIPNHLSVWAMMGGHAVSPSRFHLLSDDHEEGEVEAERSEEEDRSKTSIVATKSTKHFL